MAYRTFPYKGFGGGLNLRDAPDVVAENEAIDAMNVLFTSKGTVAQRSGYAEFTTDVGTNRYDSLAAFYTSAGTKQIIAGAGNRLEALTSTGAVLASNTTPTASPHFFQRFGTPAAEYLYIANGTNTVRRWDGAAFATPTYAGTTITGKFLALSVTDNRLVNARFSGTGAGGNPSTVRFSEEGSPDNFPTTYYQDLTPGDGEEIMGMATWRDQVFVFKQSKFFVYYGFTLDDEGEPEFLFRPVDAGVGLVAPRALTVSEQGVYFLDRTGVYFTTGSQPSRVTDPVEPIFNGATSVYYQGGVLNHANIDKCALVYHDERLWFSFPEGVSAFNNRNLIFDPHEKWFSMADIPMAATINFRPSDREELVFSYATGNQHIGRYVEGSYTADNMDQGGLGGTAISGRWQGGWFDYATPAVKTLRESKISGSGLVTIGLARDYAQVPNLSVQKELTAPTGLYNNGEVYDDPGLFYGPSGIIQPKMVRKANRGEVFSLSFSNSTIHRSFKIHKFVTHIRDVRVPSVVRVK